MKMLRLIPLAIALYAGSAYAAQNPTFFPVAKRIAEVSMEEGKRDNASKCGQSAGSNSDGISYTLTSQDYIITFCDVNRNGAIDSVDMLDIAARTKPLVHAVDVGLDGYSMNRFIGVNGSSEEFYQDKTNGRDYSIARDWTKPNKELSSLITQTNDAYSRLLTKAFMDYRL